MRIKESRGDRVFNFVLIVISAVVIFLVAYPLYFVIIASISSPEAVLAGDVTFFPIGFSLESYATIMEETKIWVGYRNTIFYTILGTAINLVLTILAAYPLSQKGMPYRRIFAFVITFTMMFSGGMIPLYLVVRDLNMLDTVWAMVIPGAIATYNLMVMKNYFQSAIPGEVLEAAEIDGCNDVTMLIKVILPLSKSIIAIVVLFYAIAHWNEFFRAILYIRDEALIPLQVVLREILLQNSLEAVGTDTAGMFDKVMRGEIMKYAVIIVSSVPVIAMYPFVQKYIISGMMSGAVKG